ncbi:hypothetical protein EV198_1976 [Roseivirga ehrenbergii]|uniref:Uncharacterized protein n=1 Tax=Roseivirga ehrenbergii (strain DSM 102268 / JCM 13514 / KCTC 12282 / NCIMB 14502 / KMM 6017) TaxID=279360 RepID=A0A150WZN9_ROSEK|nr:hypothetical protein [Roseivirga ehrenbergii]KYG71762.1 hypothetical protein MB14_10630 [Roseivirga ehrenbergii]TCL07543.1 hypothetical protein EV198_1976 [Roseivirga ehrenbergii]
MSWFSKSERIELPIFLKTDYLGFNFLSELHKFTSSKGKYKLDFQNVEWLEANLCAVLGAIIETNKAQGSDFEFINLNDRYIENTLRNNGFLNYIKQAHATPSKTHSGIPFRTFDLKDEEELEEYIYKYVLLAREVPNMSAGAKRKIFRSIFEVYQNSVMHSGANQVFVCGQFYKFKGRMALTMVEVGHTFKHNVTSHKPEYRSYDGVKSIEWAVKSGNTTKPNNETGGLGLDLIRSFLKLNNGKLQIRSADGYWEEKKGVKFVSSCSSNFEGSIVNIEFNLRDTNEYYTPEEIDIKSIL